MKNIYDLKLHEIVDFDDLEGGVMRVPGGWIYSLGLEDKLIFVPHNNEFYATTRSKKDRKLK